MNLWLMNIFREYVIDLLEAERKFLLFAHHQEMLDAVEDAVHAKVTASSLVSLCSLWHTVAKVQYSIICCVNCIEIACLEIRLL